MGSKKDADDIVKAVAKVVENRAELLAAKSNLPKMRKGRAVSARNEAENNAAKAAKLAK